MAYPTVPTTSKITLTWNDGTGNWGARLFDDLGASPTGAELATFAAAIAGYWSTNMKIYTSNNFSLVDVTVEDLSSASSSTGSWTGSDTGDMSGDPLPSNVAVDFQAKIAHRYRGGHPCFHHPPPAVTALINGRNWSPTFLTDAAAAWAAFIGDVNAYDTAPIEPDGIVVLLGYKNGALPEAVHAYPPESYGVRPIAGTMRRRLTTSA